MYYEKFTSGENTIYNYYLVVTEKFAEFPTIYKNDTPYNTSNMENK